VKVLIVGSKYPPEYAGSGVRLHRTYVRLKAKYGIACEVLCSSMVHFRFAAATYELDGIRITRISSPFKRRLGSARARSAAKAARHLLCGIDEGIRTLWFLLKRGRQFDAVHCFGYSWSCGVAVAWAGLCGKPILRELVTEASRPDDPRGLRWVTRRALRAHGTIIAISPRLAERAASLGYERIWCRPNPVDETRFVVKREEKCQLRRRYTPFADDDVVLVEFSKYIPSKNKEILPDVMRLLPAKYKLVIAGPLDGDGEHLRQRMSERIRLLGLEARVVLESGFVSRPEDYLQMSDVFLFPSISEGSAKVSALRCSRRFRVASPSSRRACPGSRIGGFARVFRGTSASPMPKRSPRR
jgi:glycosyltransferase involved in cell wall biosynthesis